MKKAKTYRVKNFEELNIFEKRFLIMMKLYRIGKMLEAAKITYPKTSESNLQNGD